MFTAILSCSTTGIFWKLTNAWFQQLSYQILRQTTHTVCSSATVFKLRAYLERHVSLGERQTQEFSKVQKWAEGSFCVAQLKCHTTGLNRPQHSHLNIDTNHHHFPDFSFLFFNLVSLEQHLSTALPLLVQAKLSIWVTYWIQFVQSQREEGGFNLPGVN